MSWANGLHPTYRPYFERLVQIAKDMDPTARVTSARRSRAEQSRLYRRFLAGKSRFPAAPPGRSKHERGLAIDLVARGPVLRRLGEIWERAGGTWGKEQDPIHFEV